MSDENPPRAAPVPARAVLRRSNHPAAVNAADQLADIRHDDQGRP